MFRQLARLRPRYGGRHVVTSTASEVGTTECPPAHIPVLCKTAIEYLQPTPKARYLDMTFGAGGHTRCLLDACPDLIVYALDRDPVAYELAQRLKEDYPERLFPMLGKFSDVPKLLEAHGVERHSLAGILFDFGCSSMQFDEAGRGFSVSKNGPLDMRMDRGRDQDGVTAAEVLAKIEEADLARILRVYGEEKAAKKIARAVVEARSAFYPIETTQQLAELVASCFSKANGEYVHRQDKLQRPAHSATKTFQALRIFVNNELNEINYGMLLAREFLRMQGRLVTITFHSLEDTIVKRHISGNVIEGLANPVPLKYSDHGVVHESDFVQSFVQSNWQQLHRHVIVPDAEEIARNSRSRSAKLRAAIRIK
ncbi:probable methyltransferase-like protein 15 homolog [Scaptodrosophila lebanonensis]|uniref:12S rRNA N(4)-cytidine methyltransferase METTL15 n=1 Tax=Drosophila lebanonensis TaxID=7225 RepID=A0A6J2TEW5_DROLE|nr:probable methyltransferase-like protein 15 homolog [Scaptodrosophila lebanonensis]